MRYIILNWLHYGNSRLCDHCILVCYSVPLCFPPPHAGALPTPTWLSIHSAHFLNLLPFWSIENMVELSKVGQTYRIPKVPPLCSQQVRKNLFSSLPHSHGRITMFSKHSQFRESQCVSMKIQHSQKWINKIILKNNSKNKIQFELTLVNLSFNAASNTKTGHWRRACALNWLVIHWILIFRKMPEF